MNTVVSKIYDKNKDIFGEPQNYRGIDFYPIKVKDIKTKELFYILFPIPKKYIPDEFIIKMSYLKFLLYIIQKNCEEEYPDTNIEKDLLDFLKSVTKCDDVFYSLEPHDENENPFNKFMINIIINGVVFSEYHFENIREIVLEQNGSSIEYVEEFNPDLEENLAFIYRNSANINFEDEIYVFCALTGMTEEEAGNKTMLQFKTRLRREAILLEYKTFKPLEVSEQVKAKHGGELWKHYFSHISPSGRYDEILIKTDKFFKETGLPDGGSI
jgi:hypothetical protein